MAAGGASDAVLPGVLAVRWMARLAENPLAAPGYYAFDLSAPIVAGTYRAARAAANVALTGAALLDAGQRAVYALCRPPGHHAGRDMCGGYCFLNNAAIATEYLLRTTNNRHRDKETRRQGDTGADLHRSSFIVHRSERVAVLDIDFHHGNGTQQIFYERDDVLFVSIHADPARHYPYFSGYADEQGVGAGEGCTHNFPLPLGTGWDAYAPALDAATTVIRRFGPDGLVVSLGVDTAAEDYDTFQLVGPDFARIGEAIGALGLPTVLVQEGGYDLGVIGRNVVAVLRSVEDAYGSS